MNDLNKNQLKEIELERALDDLQKSLPSLATDEAADFDLMAFQREAGALIDQAPAEQQDVIAGRVRYMLQQAGLGSLPRRPD
jgi:hypothetical protein